LNSPVFTFFFRFVVAWRIEIAVMGRMGVGCWSEDVKMDCLCSLRHIRLMGIILRIESRDDSPSPTWLPRLDFDEVLIFRVGLSLVGNAITWGSPPCPESWVKQRQSTR
jgi:hypothetical protein